MFNNNNQKLIDEIEQMDEHEYNNFRLKKWEEKKKAIPATPPKYFIPDKDGYLSFLIGRQKKAHLKGTKESKINIYEIEQMDAIQWNDYRIKRWTEKNAVYFGPLPEWFLQKESYLQFLKKK